jgi:hypothetical protein
MTGKKIDFEYAKDQVKPDKGAGHVRKGEQSTIAFPNYDLDAAVGVARNVYDRTGLGPCPLDELAAQAGTTMSGNFRNKNSAARLFGFIEKEGQSTVRLTDLGARVVSAEAEADARATAFLNVGLYNQIYEKYRGKLLPPMKALEREMVTLGVIPTQSAAARQIFQRSARQAGYFNSGEDRLVRPRTSSSATTQTDTIEQAVADAPPKRRDEDSGARRSGSSSDSAQYHPFVQGLLQTMPEPGTVWTIEGRAAWLEAAANIFKLIYQGDGRIVISAEAESS